MSFDRTGTLNFIEKLKQQKIVSRLHREGLTLMEIHKKTRLSIETIANWISLEDYTRTEPTPTGHPIGTLERLEVYRQRLERGEEFFHESDSKQMVVESCIGRVALLRELQGLVASYRQKKN